ncbi:MAG: hypothetical protein SFX72_13845 [Isosphaeraceae bacterium]|nr:hypothetical protein [Isosphaeraceae bacterium]
MKTDGHERRVSDRDIEAAAFNRQGIVDDPEAIVDPYLRGYARRCAARWRKPFAAASKSTIRQANDADFDSLPSEFRSSISERFAAASKRASRAERDDRSAAEGRVGVRFVNGMVQWSSESALADVERLADLVRLHWDTISTSLDVIVRGWVAAGSPVADLSPSSFPQLDRTARSMVYWATGVDPASRMKDGVVRMEVEPRDRQRDNR